MASFLGQQLNLKPAAAGAVRRSAQPVVAATKPKVAPAKKGAKPVAASKAKNRWLNADDGYDSSKWYGPDRKLFLPGGLLDPSEVPDYLDGSLPGDYGYDPLGLSAKGGKEDVEKYRAYELIHARWAMLGALGAIVPEALNANGANLPGAVWWQTGAAQLNGGELFYLGNLPTLPLPINLGITVASFFFLERFRASGEEINVPGIFPSGPAADPLYPGGGFDPLGLADDPLAFEELKVKEIKNGRLAMVSMLAFAVQAAVTGDGPYANLSKHLSGPFQNNLYTVLRGGAERAATL